jgi:SET domain
MQITRRPNAKAHKVGHKIVLRAIKDIKPGEEITYNYGRDYFSQRHHAAWLQMRQVPEETSRCTCEGTFQYPVNQGPANQGAAGQHSVTKRVRGPGLQATRWRSLAIAPVRLTQGQSEPFNYAPPNRPKWGCAHLDATARVLGNDFQGPSVCGGP